MANQAPQVPYPSWLQTRLKSMFHNPPRFENSYYGPINAILNCAFPATQYFLVKPQAVLLPNEPIVSSLYLPPDTIRHPDASRSSLRIAKAAAKAAQYVGSSGSTSHWHDKNSSISSIDSLGDVTLPRSKGGWLEGVFIPDFLVVKATENDKDIALVLVEVKLNDTDPPTSINQVVQYINRLQTKNYSTKFVAFLCIGPDSYVWTTSGQGNNCVQTMLHKSVRTGGVDFCNYMIPVRRQHWWRVL